MPLQEDYQVTLDAFCGPLDLLLYLIRRAEVDVQDIPIAEITHQYLAMLKQVDDIDIEAAGEFLVMAATLMEIKSRTLMPAGVIEGIADGEGGIEAAMGESADPRFDLIKQLLHYQRYRLASETLEQRRQAFMRQFPSQPFLSDEEKEFAGEQPALELEDAHVYDLYESYERIIASIDFTRMGDHLVEVDDTPAALYQADLLDRLQRTAEGRLTLQDCFEGCKRIQRIGLFLATLELVRLRKVLVKQEDLLADVLIELKPEVPDDQDAADPVASPFEPGPS